ncbi:glycosyltransferase family 2 protein [candidate division KSB1 bacterium]|nr:glycosyltransferase family 2 protein [candidate division KSB1 bacterium]
MKRLSVIIITLNEEHNIRECLESVTWADEIVVMDSHSTDKTRTIAREYTQHVYDVDWQGYAATKNLALEKTTGDWVLWIDADERVTDELAQTIKKVLENDSGSNGYEIPRKAYFLGCWIKHCGWYPGYVLRLVQRSHAQFDEQNVHEGFQFSGRHRQLPFPLIHYTDRNIEHYFNKYNRYTSLAVQDMLTKGKSFRLLDLMFRPMFVFLKMYIFKRGFLDGLQGFILCTFSASYVFTKYAKLWEAQQRSTD